MTADETGRLRIDKLTTIFAVLPDFFFLEGNALPVLLVSLIGYGVFA